MKPHEPVERALQDEDRRMFVDHFGPPRTAHIHPDQFALDGYGREPLVPQSDGEVGGF